MLRTLGLLLLLTPGQSDSTLPHPRPGLWEVTNTITPAGMGAIEGTKRRQECLTDTASGLNDKIMKHMAAGCTASHEAVSKNVHSFDVTCPSSRSHVETQYDSPEHYRVTTQIQMTQDPQHRTFTNTLEFRFLSTSCGDLKPGQVQPIR